MAFTDCEQVSATGSYPETGFWEIGRDEYEHEMAEPGSVLTTIRAALRDLDRELSLFRARAMEQVISDSMQDTMLQTVLLGSFPALGLVLAAIGLYGVTGYLVAQRKHEIGVRIALGAQQRDILQLVIGCGTKLTLLGVAIGLAGGLTLTRLLAAELYAVKATDHICRRLRAADIRRPFGVVHSGKARHARRSDGRSEVRVKERDNNSPDGKSSINFYLKSIFFTRSCPRVTRF